MKADGRTGYLKNPVEGQSHGFVHTHCLLLTALIRSLFLLQNICNLPASQPDRLLWASRNVRFAHHRPYSCTAAVSETALERTGHVCVGNWNRTFSRLSKVRPNNKGRFGQIRYEPCLSSWRRKRSIDAKSAVVDGRGQSARKSKLGRLVYRHGWFWDSCNACCFSAGVNLTFSSSFRCDEVVIILSKFLKA